MVDSYIGGNLADSITKTVSGIALPKGSIATVPGKTSESETIDNNKRNLENSQNSFTYPPELINQAVHDNFLIFRAYELSSSTRSYYGDMRKAFTTAQQSDFTEDGGSVSTLAGVIALYMPAMQENIEHGFNEHGTSILSDAFQNLSNIKGGESMLDTMSNVGSGSWSATKQAAGSYVAQTARGFIESNSAGQLRKNSTVAADYVSVTAFKGTSLRTQTFNYSFQPRSQDELKTVAGIIKTFYRLSLASRTNIKLPLVGNVEDNDFQTGYQKYATMLKTPPVWMIEEVSDVQGVRFTPRFVFGPAGITNIRINRTPDNYWITFMGTAGDSASIDMEITFTELIPMDRQTYDSDLASSVRGYIPGEG